MSIKCYVGDLFLINSKLDLTGVDKTNPYSFMEVREFGEEEYAFVCSYSIFSEGSRALVYRAGRLEANDSLLKSILEGVAEDCQLIIVCDELVKGRKLYNALNKLKCIEYHELDAKKFYEIGQSYGLSEKVIDAIKVRSGFDRESICTSDYVNWCKTIRELGCNVESVSKVVPESRQNSVWILKDSLFEGNLSKVMEISDTIASSKEGSPIAMVSAVLYEVRIAYKLSLFKDRKAEAMAALDKKFIGTKLSCFSSKQLGRMFFLLTDAVAKMKMGYEPVLLMKNTFVECVGVLYNK